MSVGALPAQWNSSGTTAVDSDPRQQLFTAADRGDITALQAALATGAGIDSSDWVGTAAWVACSDLLVVAVWVDGSALGGFS